MAPRPSRVLRRSVCAAALLTAAGFAAPAAAQPDPDYGIDFVTVGAAGNASYNGPDPNGFVTGRGSVGYEYRIGRLEITTAQWMGFVNTFSTQSEELRLFARPHIWGAVPDPNYNGPGMRWMLAGGPDAAMRPVLGIHWRDAARFCNWLHNGQSAELGSLQNGAYDTATFGIGPDGYLTDQRTRNPDALFWIPSLDEWIKAAHYDPDRYGPGQEGWWLSSHMSDEPPVVGVPGQARPAAGSCCPTASTSSYRSDRTATPYRRSVCSISPVLPRSGRRRLWKRSMGAGSTAVSMAGP